MPSHQPPSFLHQSSPEYVPATFGLSHIITHCLPGSLLLLSQTLCDFRSHRVTAIILQPVALMPLPIFLSYLRMFPDI